MHCRDLFRKSPLNNLRVSNRFVNKLLLFSQVSAVYANDVLKLFSMKKK